MRIVDVCGFYTPVGGGVKTYVDRKLRAAEKWDHEMIVIVPGERDSVEQVGPRAQLVSLANPPFPLDQRYRFFASEAQLHAALDRLDPDLVECGTPWVSAAMVARWRGPNRGKPVRRSLVMHCDALAVYPYRWFGNMFEREAIDRGFDFFWRYLRRLGSAYDIVVCASAGLAERMVAGGVPNVSFEPMGVEPGLFSPALRDPALRAAMLETCGLGPDATLLLGMGRHSPEKRWPMVIDAVTAAGYSREIGLLILGEGRDRPNVERAIAGNPHIHILAPIRDRPALARMMASTDALVHGCESESFGLVAIEARASGLPVIIPDGGGMIEQARGGMGWTYAPGDGAALADLLLRIIGDELAQTRVRTVAAAGNLRTMDEHFGDLFGAYAAIAEQRRAA